MKRNKTKRILIIGGGPTGIGAAYRLHDLGYNNWALFEKNEYMGGHSSTHTDEKGFLWDEGGHVLFSHFSYYDRFVKKALGKNLYRVQRESWAKLPNALAPYPFQNNIKYLKPEDQWRCIEGLLALRKKARPKHKNFREWVLNIFGEGIAELFMFPYNFQVWATPAEKMSADWIAERVSVIDAERVIGNVILNREDNSWGPNNRFIFPKYGGTQSIYENGTKLIKGDIRTGVAVKKIDIKKRVVHLSDGTSESYDKIISAMSINHLCQNLVGAPKWPAKMTSRLTYNGVYVVGLGLRKEIKTTRCWMYFADPKVPFYRLTYFHRYSPYNVPNGDTKKYSSLMCEISFSKYKKVNKKTLIDDTIQALIDNDIISSKDRSKIVSRQIYEIPQGYPVPTLDRDMILNKVQPFLVRNHIYSRGRYGAWKYEVANMDHCFMQGVQAVDAILSGGKEEVWKTWK